jgi:hypothetical protein
MSSTYHTIIESHRCHKVGKFTDFIARRLQTLQVPQEL